MSVLTEVLCGFLECVYAYVPCALKVAMTFPVHIIDSCLHIGCFNICVVEEVSLNKLRHRPRDEKSFLNSHIQELYYGAHQNLLLDSLLCWFKSVHY
jgi:hypothetical protein